MTAIHNKELDEPQVRPERRSGTISGAWWKIGTGLLMTYVIVGAFFIAKGAVGFGRQGDPARIVFFHVPCAVLSSIAYFVGVIYAVLCLSALRRGERSKSALHDIKSATAMELGFLFCLLATVTGSLFAGVQWGSFWNWDPRETSIVIMLLLYASYLVLRGALAEHLDRRLRLSSVYALVALVPAQYLIWAVPRLVQTMHPTTTLSDPSNTSLSYKLVLYPSFLAFTLLFVWLFQLRVRQVQLSLRQGMQAAVEHQHDAGKFTEKE
jgi:heme exporter protein C